MLAAAPAKSVSRLSANVGRTVITCSSASASMLKEHITGLSPSSHTAALARRSTRARCTRRFAGSANGSLTASAQRRHWCVAYRRRARSDSFGRPATTHSERWPVARAARLRARPWGERRGNEICQEGVCGRSLTRRPRVSPSNQPVHFSCKQAKFAEKTEGEGFEPSSEENPLKRFSRPPHSTALPPLPGSRLG